MATIEERAKEYMPDAFDENEVIPAREGHIVNVGRSGYIAGAKDQRKIDIQRAKDAFDKAVGWCRTYPWYDAVLKEFIKAMED